MGGKAKVEKRLKRVLELLKAGPCWTEEDFLAVIIAFSAMEKYFEKEPEEFKKEFGTNGVRLLFGS